MQKSVFLGDIAPNRVEEIIQFSTELLDLKTDAVYVFPMCRPDFDKVRIVGQGFDRELVADEVLTKSSDNPEPFPPGRNRRDGVRRAWRKPSQSTPSIPSRCVGRTSSWCRTNCRPRRFEFFSQPIFRFDQQEGYMYGRSALLVPVAGSGVINADAGDRFPGLDHR